MDKENELKLGGENELKLEIIKAIINAPLPFKRFPTLKETKQISENVVSQLKSFGCL